MEGLLVESFHLSNFTDGITPSFYTGATQLLEIPTQTLFTAEYTTNSHFEDEIKDEKDVSDALMDRIPLNTRKATASAVSTCAAWEKMAKADMVFDNDMLSWDYWLAWFIDEARKLDGKTYSPSSPAWQLVFSAMRKMLRK